MDLGMFAKKIQISEILSKYNVPIKEAIIIGAVIEELEQQCKKQKEVIDRAIDYLETKRIREKAIIDVDVLEGILKEVLE